jgi:hypothetical protein
VAHGILTPAFIICLSCIEILLARHKRGHDAELLADNGQDEWSEKDFLPKSLGQDDDHPEDSGACFERPNGTDHAA